MRNKYHIVNEKHRIKASMSYDGKWRFDLQERRKGFLFGYRWGTLKGAYTYMELFCEWSEEDIKEYGFTEALYRDLLNWYRIEKKEIEKRKRVSNNPFEGCNE